MLPRAGQGLGVCGLKPGQSLQSTWSATQNDESQGSYEWEPYLITVEFLSIKFLDSKRLEQPGSTRCPEQPNYDSDRKS